MIALWNSANSFLTLVYHPAVFQNNSSKAVEKNLGIILPAYIQVRQKNNYFQKKWA